MNTKISSSQNKYIAITPGLRGGKPHIAGTRITVSDIVIMRLKLAQSVAEIAAEYSLSLASVYAALTYYYDHQSEIDQQMVDDEVFVEAFQKQHPSKLLETPDDFMRTWIQVSSATGI